MKMMFLKLHKLDFLRIVSCLLFVFSYKVGGGVGLEENCYTPLLEQPNPMVLL